MPASSSHTGGSSTGIPTTVTMPGAGMGHGGSTSGTGTPSAPSWPTVSGIVDQFFTAFDTSKNGSITVAEITAVLDPGAHHTELNAVVTRMVALIDANADGTLTKPEVSSAFTQLDSNGDGSLSPADLGPALAHAGQAELLAALMQGFPLPGGGGPKPVPTAPTVAQVVDTLVTRFDADKSSTVSLAELLAVLDPQARHNRLDDLLKAVVAAVDTDHDGQMSKAELTTAIGSLDSDDNGKLDHRDHVPGPPGDDAVDLIGVLLPHMRDFDIDTLGHFD